jgi:hypothetical protein
MTHTQLIAFRWRLGDDLRIVVSNPGDRQAQGHVLAGADLPGGGLKLAIEDQIGGERYEWDRDALVERGVYVRLDPGRAHLFHVRCVSGDETVILRRHGRRRDHPDA